MSELRVSTVCLPAGLRESPNAADLPTSWLAELADGRRQGAVTPTAARAELDERTRRTQESLCLFLDRLTDRIAGPPAARGAP